MIYCNMIPKLGEPNYIIPKQGDFAIVQRRIRVDVGHVFPVKINPY